MEDRSPSCLMTRKLHRLLPLDDAARAAIASLQFRERQVVSHSLIVREGDRVEECCLLMDGTACRQKVSNEGNRQIVSFHVQGDLLDLQHLHLDRADHNVQALTACRLAWVSKTELSRLVDDHPSLAHALWKDTLIDASIFREWVLNVGQRDARVRIAHMLTEFVARRLAAGMSKADSLQIPMTQEQIGDATGLTAVHVNRMLRALREDGILTLDRMLGIKNWERLQRVAGFTPEYLHEAA